MRGISPHVRRFTRALTLGAALFATPAAAFQTDDARADLVAVTAAGDMMYALDATTGHVSFATVPSDLPASIPIDTMTGLRLPSSVRCVAIGTRWNRLLFVDAGAKNLALRELDPQSGAIYEIRTEVPLLQPASIAASAAGDIAIADQGRRATIWLREKEGVQVVPWPSAIARLVHLQFDGRALSALDLETGHVVALPPPGPARPATPSAQTAGAVLPDLRDFSVLRGIYYLATRSALFALAPGGTPRRIPCAACPASPAAIRATAQRLFVYDATSRQIAILPRPVPVGMSIETTFADAQQALGAFYRYLADREWLSVRQYTATRPADRVVDALGEARVIIPPPGGGTAALPEALATVLCRYNRAQCRDSTTYWNGPLAAGTTLTVPDYTIAPFVRTDTVDLKGTSVADHLIGVRGLDANAGRLEYVQNLNTESFENALARRGFVVASPARGDLAPGSIVTVRNGAELVGQGVSALCGGQTLPAVVERMTPIDIPDRVTHVAFKDYVPVGTNPDGSPKDLGVKDGDQYVMSFRRTKIVQLDTGTFAASDLARRFVDCMKKLAVHPATAPEPLLVVEALRVEGALYEFYQPPRSIRIEQPFYLAYKAVPASAFANRSIADAFAATATPTALKPGGPQDLLSRRTGSLQLPTMGWSLNALVPAADLENPSSPLHAIERVATGRILFLSREVVATAGASLSARSDDGEPQDLDPPTIAQMKAEREALLNAIDYRDIARESRAAVRVAVGEAGVDLDHPAMAETQSGTAISAFWTQTKPDQPFVRHQIATPAASNPRRRKFTIDDHGVHVAGLLGARELSLLPGLVPHADLFVIDTSNVNASDLHKSIMQAASQGVKVFNLSLSFENLSEGVLQEMRRDFKNTFENQLFIVAAGDLGRDLSDFPDPPIGWMRDVRTHMIGVGTTTPDGKNYEREYEDGSGPDHKIAVSNVGQEYVQLAAPGRGVFSLARDNSYTDATGTSQAAPQVTAAAAMLSKYTPDQIKARLIYTASWIDPNGYIWGGRLNMRRAVWSPAKNLYVDKSDVSGPPVAAEFEPSMTVTIGGSDVRMIESDGLFAVPPPAIPFVDVMRLTTLPSGLYRVHFIDRMNGNRLRIIDEADVHGTAQFRGTPARWDPARQEFVDFDPAENGLDISEFMFDYVSRVPDDICGFRQPPCSPTISF